VLDLVRLTHELLDRLHPGDWPEKMLSVRGFFVGCDNEDDQ
jgi:hypothetical protein